MSVQVEQTQLEIPPAPESVEPSEAQGAQVPLQTFNIPTFPPTAQNIKALTLTSDIQVDQYQNVLAEPFSVPPLPAGIESLTLELFSLGYPPGLLSALADRLPNLNTIVIYSQLFAGTTAESQADAIEFFRKLPGLRALHFLDVFAKPGFFAEVGQWLRHIPEGNNMRRGLMFLEVNYTFRHEDEEFMGKIHATELPSLIGPGLISCLFNLTPPESAGEDDQDPTTIQEVAGKEGVMAFNKTLAGELVDSLTDERTAPVHLKALNTTMYTLTAEQLTNVLDKQRHILLLNITADIEPGEEKKKALLQSFHPCESLEQIEIVANPSLQFLIEAQNPRSGVLSKTFPTEEDMRDLGKHAPKLASFKANVLRINSFGSVEWSKEDGQWRGGVAAAKPAVAPEA